MSCELCQFNNPKCSVTAVIIKLNKLLVLKRNEDPYKDKWDLPGGYMNAGETPKEAMARELKEELNVTAKLDFISAIPGTGMWKGEKFAVLSHFFLADIGNQPLLLNSENSENDWIPLFGIDKASIAFDSNQKMVEYLSQNFAFNLEEVRELLKQLDPSAEFNEQYLYRALIQGTMAKRYKDGKLIGFGWAFPRQTMLRRQAVVEDMIVDENARGQGYGRDILRLLIDAMIKQDQDMMELTTNPSREAANALYQSEGFNLHITNHRLLSLKNYEKPS